MKKRRKPFSRAAGWQAIKLRLVSNMYQDHSESSRSDLLLPAYAALLSLERGALDVDGFYLLNEMNAAGFGIMEVLYERSTQAVKTDIDRRVEIPRSAADAMESIGHRYNRTGKFGATGNELQAVRAAITNLDELSKSAPVGVLVQALQRANALINSQKKD